MVGGYISSILAAMKRQEMPSSWSLFLGTGAEDTPRNLFTEVNIMPNN